MHRSVSISNIRKIIENKAVSVGCFSILFVAFAASFLSQGPNCRGGAGTRGGATAPDAVAVVGNYHATAHEVDLTVDQDRAQMASQASAFDSLTEASSYGESLQKALNNGLIQILAERNGVAATDGNADQAVPSMASQMIDETRSQLVAQGKLKKDASNEEFAKQFKEQVGQTPDEWRKDFETQFLEGLKDPSRHDAILAQISRANLLQKYLSQTTVTEEDVKRAYSNFKFQKMDFTGPDAKTKAQQALAELKAGTAFEKVAEKYVPKQVKSLTTELPGAYFSIVPGFEPLKNLQVGQVSDPIESGSTQSIFKLIGLTPKLPPDFEKQKDQLRRQQQQQAALTKMNSELEALQKSEKIEWKSPAYQALYEFRQAQNDFTIDAAQRKQRMKEIAEKASAAVNGDASGSHVAALTEFAAVSSLYDGAPPAEQKQLVPLRIKSIQDLLQSADNPKLRLELAGLLMDTGEKEQAVDMLKTAAEYNNDLSAAGQGLYNSIQGKLEQFKKEKKITDLEAKSIQDELDRWRNDKREQDRMAAEAKKQQAEEEKKLKAEADAAAKANPKPATPAPAAPTKK